MLKEDWESVVSVLWELHLQDGLAPETANLMTACIALHTASKMIEDGLPVENEAPAEDESDEVILATLWVRLMNHHNRINL